MALIEISNLTKTYKNGKLDVPVLMGISLQIEQGEFVAIMGPSGSGKSTFMNILGCLDRPTGGEYILDGQDVARLNDNELAEIRNLKFGFVFQSFNLIARTTALQNVELPMLYARRSDRHERAKAALDRVGLTDRAHHKPNELSGGQQQRVAIARALVNDPVVLMADEPTGALDSRTSVEIMDIFQELNREGRTIVMVTHEADVAEHATRVIRFVDGLVEEDHPVEHRRDARIELEEIKQRQAEKERIGAVAATAGAR